MIKDGAVAYIKRQKATTSQFGEGKTEGGAVV